MLKINYIKYSAIIVSFIIFLFPLVILAGSTGFTIDNPLGEKATDLKVLLVKIMNLVAKVGGIVVVFFIIYSGFKFVTAQGNEGKLDEAKDMFKWTVIGGAILLGADIIANLVVTTVKKTTGVE